VTALRLHTTLNPPESQYTKMDSIQIPYYAHPEELPSELPTKNAIKSSKEVLCEQSARKVVGVAPCFVAKYGLQVDLEEGLNMIFIKNTTSILVPAVYALFKDSEKNENYIIMERIQGSRLDSIWSSLDDAQKRVIAFQIKVNFTELRKLVPLMATVASAGSLFEIIYSTPDLRTNHLDLKALSRQRQN
jgi:hypothetical protein